jgi:Arc/MetJ family transcription regulator
MDFVNNRAELLRTAREAFPGFYAAATPRDTAVMDALVVAHVALMIAINAPREFVAAVLRTELERMTNAHEQMFSELRELLRASPTFARLSIGEQLAIERAMLSCAPVTG